jgi:hypothetical protein
LLFSSAYQSPECPVKTMRHNAINSRGTAVISFLWNTYGTRSVNHDLAGIAPSEANAERHVRRAFKADAAIRGATIWEVKLTVSPDGQQFEWQPVRIGLIIFARDDERGVVALPRRNK